MAFDCAAPCPPPMTAVGLTWLDVQEVANHVVALLEKDGAIVADLCRNLMKLVQSVSGRNLVGIISALSASEVDVRQIIADVKAEFGL